MKRIVIDVRQSGTSTGRYHDKLVEYLHRLKPGYDIVLIAHHNRLEYLRATAPGFKVVSTKFREFSFGEQLGFYFQIKRLKADLVHFGMIQQPILYTGKTVTSMLDLTPLNFKNPEINSLIYAIRQRIFGAVVRRVAKKSLAVLCISDYVKKEIVDYTGISADKISLTYNAADHINEPSVAIKSLIGKSFIMYVGRPQPHKNLTRLIEAFGIINKSHPDIFLVLAGKKDSLYKIHEEFVLDKGIKNVVFTDFVSEGELRWLYENTLCYVFPSLSEGFGLPGLEAMAHGAPVASSNATCLPEVYGDAAAYFNPLDIKHIAVVIQDIVDNSVYANKLRTRGEKRVACFSWEKMAKETLSVYRDVLGDS